MVGRACRFMECTALSTALGNPQASFGQAKQAGQVARVGRPEDTVSQSEALAQQALEEAEEDSALATLSDGEPSPGKFQRGEDAGKPAGGKSEVASESKDSSSGKVKRPVRTSKPTPGKATAQKSKGKQDSFMPLTDFFQRKLLFNETDIASLLHPQESRDDF